MPVSRFTPVKDPERARCEQDEESLRRHRQFDTPFALLGKDLNDESKEKKDSGGLGQPDSDLYKDEHQLWRRKAELFDKQKTWGRETMEYSNPEQARAEGNNGPQWGRPGTVGWGVKGNFGGKGEDKGLMVLQRNEVDQAMVKNEKGLWVKKKKGESGPDELPVPEDKWRCVCGELVSKRRSSCEDCGAPKTEPKEKRTCTDSDMLRKPKKGEDPRMEAAKLKGRGTEDATQQALKALQARRKMETQAKEEVGMMRRRDLGGKGDNKSGPVTTLNSSSQQVRPAARHKKYHNWQGVQTSLDEAKKIVGKAVGFNQIGNAAPDQSKREEVVAPTRCKTSPSRKGPEDLEWRAESPSASRSRSRSRGKKRDPSPAPRERWDGSVEVDFF